MTSTKSESTSYIVTLQGDAMSTHRTEAAAVKAAVKLDPTARVSMVVTSGSYRSTTQIHPTRGNTYAS